MTTERQRRVESPRRAGNLRHRPDNRSESTI